MSDADIATIRNALVKKEGHLPLPMRWMTISFEIALHQGCRFSETSLPLSDIDLSSDPQRITFHAKCAKVFTTKLNPGLVPMIRQLKATNAERTCIHPALATRE